MLDRFGNDETGRARQRHFSNFLPSCLSEPCIRFLLAIGLPLPGDDEELSRYQSCWTRLSVTWIGPQIDEQQPCTRLHTCPHLEQQFEVVQHREDMGGVCDDYRIMVGGQRVIENITLNNVDPRTLG